MVAIVWLCAVAASSLFATQLAPKLPVYHIGILGVLPVWAQGTVQTRLHVNVALHNENLVPVHLHALTFDLFSMDWNGQLVPLGKIQDAQQIRGPKDTVKLGKKAKHEDKPKSQAIWKIPPKKFFSQGEYLYTTLSLWSLIRTFGRILYSLWQHSGALVLPTTGVAHVTTNAMPVTVGLVCDNLIHLFGLKVVGVQCTLHGVQPGFADLEASVISLRQYAMENLKGNETGGVLYKSNRNITIDWKDWED